jgi:hypothetical protein
LNEPTSKEDEPGREDEPMHNVDAGDVKNARINGNKDSSSSVDGDDALIHEADSGGAKEEAKNDGDKGSGIFFNLRRGPTDAKC